MHNVIYDTVGIRTNLRLWLHMISVRNAQALATHNFPTQHTMKHACFIVAATPRTSVRRRRRAATCAPPRMVVGESVAPGMEVVAGSIALVTPVLVAAVLFGERIVRQRRCELCNGSGLVPIEPDSDILTRCAKYVCIDP